MSTLKQRWEALRAETPGMRIRDAARRLSVSEAALLETRYGAGVRRLATSPLELGEALPAFGPVMSLVRNEAAVHEKENVVAALRIDDDDAELSAPGFVLRIPSGIATFAYAVEDTSPKGALRSIQFFDSTGTALWKLYARTGTVMPAFDAFLDAHGDSDETPTAFASGAAEHPAAADAPSPGMLALPSASLQAFLEQVAQHGLGLSVVTGNGSVTQTHLGRVHRIVRMGSWLNILDPGFDWHLDESGVETAHLEGAHASGSARLRLADRTGATLAVLSPDRGAPAAHAATWLAVLDTMRKGP